MEIIVCVKPVLEPDLPPAKFNIDSAKKCAVTPEGMPLVINPYDALALEAAIRIREQNGGRITALTLAAAGEDVLRKALAMGADEACLIGAEGVEEYDGFAKAALLSLAVRKIGPFNLILCGRQAADWDMGITGSIMAEYLGIPVITRAKKIEADNAHLHVERITSAGNESYEVEMPALVTISSEFGQARIPSGWGIVAAAKKKITRWSRPDLGDKIPAHGGTTLLSLSLAANRRNCEFIRGEDMAQAAANLAAVLSGIAK